MPAPLAFSLSAIQRFSGSVRSLFASTTFWVYLEPAVGLSEFLAPAPSPSPACKQQRQTARSEDDASAGSKHRRVH